MRVSVCAVKTRPRHALRASWPLRSNLFSLPLTFLVHTLQTEAEVPPPALHDVSRHRCYSGCCRAAKKAQRWSADLRLLFVCLLTSFFSFCSHCSSSRCSLGRQSERQEVISVSSGPVEPQTDRCNTGSLSLSLPPLSLSLTLALHPPPPGLHCLRFLYLS